MSLTKHAIEKKSKIEERKKSKKNEKKSESKKLEQQNWKYSNHGQFRQVESICWAHH